MRVKGSNEWLVRMSLGSLYCEDGGSTSSLDDAVPVSAELLMNI